jgi:hypothetical protein
MPDIDYLYGKPPIVGPDLYSTPREMMPAVDLVKCFSDLCEKYNQVAKKDLVNSYLKILLMDVADEKKILPKLLPNGSSRGKYKYGDDHFEYCYQDHFGNAPCKKGHWLKRASHEAAEPNSEIRGYCIFSFISFIEGCNTPLEAVECVAKYLKVNFLERNTTQPNEIGGYSFVDKAFRYLPSAFEDVATHFLGPTNQKPYEFHNMFGKVIFALRVWKVHGQDSIQLFRTTQRYEENGKAKYLETCIAPPWKMVIYNLDLINEQKIDDIFIHDDIGRTRSWDQSGINTWSGEITFVSEIEWDILKKRNVKYVFDPRSLSSCKIAMKLREKFDEIATGLELITCEETYQEENIECSSSYDPKDKKMNFKTRTLKSEDEFYDLAKEYHGNDIDKRPKNEGLRYQVRTLQDLSGIKEEIQFMVHPLFKKGEFVVLFAASGIGKSFVTLDLVLMIAGGGSWDERLSAKQQYKILYVDAENDFLEIDMRLKGLIKGNYGNEEKLLKNIVWIYFLDPKNEDTCDLSIEKDRQAIGDRAKGFDLLVLDNLDALTSPNISTNRKEWMGISTWIKSLNKKGTAVLLLHHENKEGKMSGTVNIVQNANMTISLTEPSVEQEAVFPTKGKKVIFKPEKTRYLRKDDEKKGFLLVYNDENGQINRTILSLEGRPIEKENKSFVTEEDINKYKLNKLDILILNKARNPDVEFVTAADFKDENAKGRKGQTVTDHFDKLVKLGLLVGEGENKGRKYRAVDKDTQTED